MRIFFSVALLLCNCAIATAQKPVTQITGIKQKDDHVRVSLISSKPFIFGSNIYVLYIGSKQFARNDQWHHNGKGYMTFFIEMDEYESLQDGAAVYLTYGEVNAEEENMAELAQTSRRCWALGKFSKSQLKK